MLLDLIYTKLFHISIARVPSDSFEVQFQMSVIVACKLRAAPLDVTKSNVQGLLDCRCILKNFNPFTKAQGYHNQKLSLFYTADFQHLLVFK